MPPFGVVHHDWHAGPPIRSTTSAMATARAIVGLTCAPLPMQKTEREWSLQEQLWLHWHQLAPAGEKVVTLRLGSTGRGSMAASTPSLEEARTVRNEMAKRLHGKFARLTSNLFTIAPLPLPMQVGCLSSRDGSSVQAPALRPATLRAVAR